ncbi:unnamed protein product [Nesidiocoris tenuis]|uniref:Uncharacterized protein n=1 Tax=Nesidiocoris tenuis TaxID=355587 RepID=A0A6H5HNK3_9HEMI|nr:unnamed protein product [Nesidiocoris tenuis]
MEPMESRIADHISRKVLETPGGAEPGNPSPSINDITSRPDQHGGSSDQPPGTAQQAVGATIPRIYDPRACSFV